MQAVKSHLSEWFGADEVRTWEHLRTYRIPFAQPGQTPPTNFNKPVSLGHGVFVCGDHRGASTLDSAIQSGRSAASALIASVSK